MGPNFSFYCLKLWQEKDEVLFSIKQNLGSLNFVLKNSQVFSVVPGMSSINEVRDNIQIANEAMPEELWASLSKDKFI